MTKISKADSGGYLSKVYRAAEKVAAGRYSVVIGDAFPGPRAASIGVKPAGPRKPTKVK
jgi:hypothetical protein